MIRWFVIQIALYKERRGCSPVDANGEVLRQLVTIVEDDDQVDMELDLESSMLVGGTGVSIGEQHVKGNLEIREHIAVSHLDVLNLCSIGFSFEGLHANKLNLN